ncbi:hypothetical protein OG746_38110 [Streptomyces sp. NBC_01016]|nr:hypothetical protein [Streptomyces sp. NBC_01016]MCX4834527.1 hypothetical protein [Streptomyces sp. NBC_01016]
MAASGSEAFIAWFSGRLPGHKVVNRLARTTAVTRPASGGKTVSARLAR